MLSGKAMNRKTNLRRCSHTKIALGKRGEQDTSEGVPIVALMLYIQKC